MRAIARVSHGADMFNESDYFYADPRTGVITTRAGRRIVCLTDDFLIGFRSALIEECGEAADIVLYSCGEMTGRLVGKRLRSELSEHYGQDFESFLVGQFIACLRSYFNAHGWGLMSLELGEVGQGLFVLGFENPPFAELFEARDRPLDSLLAGFLGGVFSAFTGQELRCVQTRCQSQGHASSLFIVGLSERLEDAEGWVEEGLSHDEVVARLAELRV